jgi:hypothetical protein
VLVDPKDRCCCAPARLTVAGEFECPGVAGELARRTARKRASCTREFQRIFPPPFKLTHRPCDRSAGWCRPDTRRHNPTLFGSKKRHRTTHPTSWTGGRTPRLCVALHSKDRAHPFSQNEIGRHALAIWAFAAPDVHPGLLRGDSRSRVKHNPNYTLKIAPIRFPRMKLADIRWRYVGVRSPGCTSGASSGRQSLTSQTQSKLHSEDRAHPFSQNGIGRQDCQRQQHHRPDAKGTGDVGAVAEALEQLIDADRDGPEVLLLGED